MTERDQGAFEEALRLDLAAERQKVLLVTDQLRQANGLNEGLAHKVDFLTQEVTRVTAGREQYEKVSIRVATLAECVATIAIKQLEDLREEIRSAAFAKVPGAVQNAPETLPARTGEPEHGPEPIGIPTQLPESDIVLTMKIGDWPFIGNGSSADLLPPARLGWDR